MRSCRSGHTPLNHTLYFWKQQHKLITYVNQESFFLLLRTIVSFISIFLSLNKTITRHLSQLFVVFPDSSSIDCTTTATSTQYQYQYVWPQIPTGVTSFTFRVKASNDAFIGLSPTNADANDMYEIGRLNNCFLFRPDLTVKHDSIHTLQGKSR
jgi:hypothetical protein